MASCPMRDVSDVLFAGVLKVRQTGAQLVHATRIDTNTSAGRVRRLLTSKVVTVCGTRLEGTPDRPVLVFHRPVLVSCRRCRRSGELIREGCHVDLSGYETVEDAAIAWWEAKRPITWTEEAHLANPCINVSTWSESALALQVSRLVRDRRSHV